MARHVLSALVWGMLGAGAALGQTTAFTYQGQLTDAAQPANGNFDLQFALFGNASGGAQIGTTQTVSTLPVSGGVFTVQLDFGVSAFPGANRFLEIGVRPTGGGSFTTLAPRQQISSTPYAIRTLSAATADALSSACVGCVQDTQILSIAGSKVSGTIPAVSVPAGSGNYVQNTTTQQTASNFNISGNGTVGGNLTVNGTLNANVSGNFIENRSTPQSNANFDIAGNGTVGQTLSAGAVAAGPAVQHTPQLDVNGTAWFRGDSTPLTGYGNGVALGYDSAGGYLFAFDYGTGNVNTPLNLLLNAPGGNVGIGTTSPTTKLEVDADSGDAVYGVSTSARGVVGASQGQAGVVGVSNSFDGVFGLSHDTNNAGVFGTNDSTGGSGVAGVSTNGAGTQGNSTSGPGVAGNSVSGVGTQGNSTNGSGVYGESAASQTLTHAGVYGKSTGNGGIGVIGEANINNAVGVFGVSTSAKGFGVYGRNNSGGVAMEADGDASQIRTAGGWVKAMVLVNSDGSIARCYNSQTGLTNSNCPATATTCCGIKVQHPSLGFYYADFGFVVTDRFYSVQAINTGTEPDVYAELEPPGSAFNVPPSVNQLFIIMSYVATQNPTDSPLVIVVF